MGSWTRRGRPHRKLPRPTDSKQSRATSEAQPQKIAAGLLSISASRSSMHAVESPRPYIGEPIADYRPREPPIHAWISSSAASRSPNGHLARYESLSKIIVAWIRSPPPMPLLPDDAVVMVCSRYPSAACLLITFSSSVRFPEPVPHSFSLRMT